MRVQALAEIIQYIHHGFFKKTLFHSYISGISSERSIIDLFALWFYKFKTTFHFSLKFCFEKLKCIALTLTFEHRSEIPETARI